MNQRLNICIVLLILACLILSSCNQTTLTSEDVPQNDLLGKILSRGTLVVATDPGYPPQSELVEGAARNPNTKCSPSEYTVDEMVGFDVAVAVEIANRLNVEACFVTPPWTQLTAGNWDGRWDISVGSMAITPDRMEALYFTQPYYATPAALFIHQNNTTYVEPADLSDKRVGGCTNCTYEAYLQHSLVIPGSEINYVIDNPVIIGYDVDLPALEDLALGDGIALDAVLVAQPTGLQAIEDGFPIKQLGEPVFFEYLSAAIDKKSSLDPIPFVRRVTEIILGMHQDDTLATFSQEYYGQDFTRAAGAYDISSISQFP